MSKQKSICDVPGITVGHYTLQNENHNTGITFIRPKNNIVDLKMEAGLHIINGFGKSIGTIQVQELGEIESAIALTNTMAAGRVTDFLTTYSIDEYKLQNKQLTTFNPLVFECNDSFLNDIQDNPFSYDNFLTAVNQASVDFTTGSVGAGTGMSCHQLKGGIGTSSEQLQIGGDTFTIGCLVLTNYGVLEDLIVNHQPIGKHLIKTIPPIETIDKGSAIVIIATDLPLSSNQLTRISKRGVVGLSASGSIIGHGSGEIVLTFSTANQSNQDSDFIQKQYLDNKHLNSVFRSTIKCIEDSVLNSMLTSEQTTYKNHFRHSLSDFI